VAVGFFSLWLRWRQRLFDVPALLWVVVAMAPAGLVALLCGWITTEVGRQPFTVYGQLRTADSVSPIGVAGVGTSLVAFVVVYVLVFGAGAAFILRLLVHPPQPGEPEPAPAPMHAAGITPHQPLTGEA